MNVPNYLSKNDKMGVDSLIMRFEYIIVYH